MSFAYKKIQPSNITNTPYKANKLFNINNDAISGSGITIYIGEYQPLDQVNFFDPVNDYKTSNNEYRRLIYNSVKHLFYKDYIDTNGLFIESSSYEHYPQTNLYSGSYTTNIRNINNTTGSSYQGVNSVYNKSVVYDSIYLYDDASFDNNKGSLVTILSIDKNLYGNNIKPYTFSIIFDDYYIRDDGNGNIFDYGNKINYDQKIEDNLPGDLYIGNIFYSLGLIVITNNDYICILGSPPVAVNNYYEYFNLDQPINFDILSNDYTDCGGIDYSSINLITGSSPLESYIGSDNMLYISNSQSSFIPGNYQLYYTINANNGLLSNLGTINIDIKQQKLSIDNFISDKLCFNVEGLVSCSFNINGGVPVYSYSWDNNNYHNISGFYNISVSESVHTTSQSLYVKDYIGNVVSYSLNGNYNNIEYSLIKENSINCQDIGTITINSNDNIIYTLNGEPTEYDSNTIYNISTGSYTASIENITTNCIVVDYFEIDKNDAISYKIESQSISCYSGSDGFIKITSLQEDIDSYSFIISSSNYIGYSYQALNIPYGTYNIEISNNSCTYSQSVILTQPEQIIISTTSSYDFECYSGIEINPQGGTPPYLYIVNTPSGSYQTYDNNISFQTDGLNGYSASIKVVDSNDCFSTSSHEIYGRKYIYSGSYCEQIP